MKWVNNFVTWKSVKICYDLLLFSAKKNENFSPSFTILLHWAVNNVYPLKEVWKSPSLSGYFINLYRIIDWANNVVNQLDMAAYNAFVI